jgi:hypothetical protein
MCAILDKAVAIYEILNVQMIDRLISQYRLSAEHLTHNL